ncbi:uncharacterized protein LOC119990755 isoform X1 [Tripterygium wilfordii]|uniref:uncharacterized protein LOC119990755 isoform X1 n=1 Tax=Tripterygium wilfordii TaxID=458696 RepID=UPI0018F7F148|nr:uncharacterized protein LOC119990755 isoform X1 [Tripterygium wilfordii]
MHTSATPNVQIAVTCGSLNQNTFASGSPLATDPNTYLIFSYNALFNYCTASQITISSCSSGKMWNCLPFDLLSKIFSLLAPDSLARARSVCGHWHESGKLNPLTTTRNFPAWFVGMPARNRGQYCYIHNPGMDTWHELHLNFLPDPVRQFRQLPLLNVARTNPAVGVLVMGRGPFPFFQVYVAGGMSDLPSGSATYESTLEMYNSRNDTWQIVGSMPMEFAVRLTVWTPNECVYSNGVLYWMTSARAYSVMGFEIGPNIWIELRVPMADRLEFAALVERNGRLTLVGGTCGSDACVWELSEGYSWVLIDKVPIELSVKLVGDKRNWCGAKCVGSKGAICLYRDLGSGMIVWREVGENGMWEWNWVDGCCFVRGKQVHNMQIKGVLLYPDLATSCNEMCK